MIYSHLPENPRWQLLSTTISMPQFTMLPGVSSTFFNLKLIILSPCNTNMVPFDTNRSLVEVLIRTLSDVYLSCSVDHDNTSGLAQYDVDRKLWYCLFRPRSSGYQTLDIYARKGRPTGFSEGAIVLGLNMPKIIQFQKFPYTYDAFTSYKCQIFEPLTGKLKRDTKVTIHCRIPGADYVCLSYDGTLSSNKYNLADDIFKEEITVPKREITIYAKFPKDQESNHVEGLFKYTVERQFYLF
ncbi:unnamed protein product [Rotaria socialis]